MHEDLNCNLKIIEATYGSIEKYKEMQSRVADLSQSIIPLHNSDELLNIGRLMSERLSVLLEIIDDSWKNRVKEIQNILDPLSQLTPVYNFLTF